jgi:UDP-3-O-[3-hydroxymyristoyl] glucosamine N-acyltransferase
MQLKASEICKMIQGELIGNPDTIIKSFSNIKDAKKGDVTFLSDVRYEKYIHLTQASLIIVPHIKFKTEITLIKTTNVAQKFIDILNVFFPKKIHQKGISINCNISKNAKIGKQVTIENNCVIENNVTIEEGCFISANTFIGENSIIKSNANIGPNVTIYNDTEIGKNCIIHAGAVIGSDGFGFVNKDQKLLKMPQLGKVIILNNVEIGANTTIDRGTLENTQIGNGVKLDNLIQIGHNVNIGANTVIAAQTGVAGSTKIGENCMIGGQVAISNHLKIGNNVKIAGNSGVIKNIPNNKIVQGPLAFDIKNFQKSYVHFKNLTHIVSDIKKLKK